VGILNATKEFVNNLNNKLARQFVSTYANTELNELDIAILWIIHRTQNPFAKKHSEWTISHLDKKLKEMQVSHAYNKMIKQIYEVLEPSGLIRVEHWSNIFKTKEYIDGKGNQSFLMPTEKGQKCLNDLEFYTSILIKAKQKKEKEEKNMNLGKTAATTLLFLLLMITLANAACIAYAKDQNNHYYPDINGLYILCDYPDLLECQEQLNQDINIAEAIECQEKKEELEMDLNQLMTDYQILNDDKNGISTMLNDALVLWGQDLNKISTMQQQIQEKDQNNLEMQGELNQIRNSESTCNDLNKYYEGLILQAGDTEAIVKSMKQDFIDFKSQQQQKDATTQTSYMALNTKTDNITIGLIIAAIAVIAIVFAPKALKKIKKPPKRGITNEQVSTPA